MKNTFKILALLLLITTFSFNGTDQKVVVIDVAHGGKDSGTFADEISEKEINLSIANKIQALAKNSNIRIVLTRDSDKFMSLEERVDFVNSLDPDYLISLHFNSSDNENAKGAEIYVSQLNNGDNRSIELAERINAKFPKSKEKADIKNANMYVLKNVDCPAVLVEMGFLSNLMDKAYLMSDKGQNEMAKAVFSSVQ